MKTNLKVLDAGVCQAPMSACAHNSFCGSLTPETRAMLCAMKTSNAFRRKKESLFYPEKERKLMLIRRGELFTLREHHTGRQKAIESLTEGDIIGASHLFGVKNGLPIHLYAKDAAEVCVFPMDKFEAMMGRPDFAQALIRNIVARFAAAISQLEHMTMDSSEDKIFYVLGTRKHQDGPAPDARESLSLTHRELALLAGINRITATRAIEQLREAGRFGSSLNPNCRPSSKTVDNGAAPRK